MKERPILFSTPMVRALLDDRKTQTRRIIKPQPVRALPQEFIPMDQAITRLKTLHQNGNTQIMTSGPLVGQAVPKCPYGEIGDRLWVRESFTPNYFDGGGHGYKADWTKAAAEVATEPKWKPSIHMPRKACRLLLEITEVRVERLQDIDEEDAVWEGIEGDEYGELWMDYTKKHDDPERHLLIEPSASYRTLWQSINGPKSWDANPWVWAITFKKI